MLEERVTRRAKQKYPNLPDDFRKLAFKKRKELGISQREMAEDLGKKFPSFISQLEIGERNFTYEIAKQFRDYLGLEYDLPEPHPENAEVIIRKRKKAAAVEGESFYIVVDGELIEVMKYRRLGPITKAKLA